MKIKFEPRDWWIGVYWDKNGRVTTIDNDWDIYHVYVCIIPCFPIYFTFKRPVKPEIRHKNW